MSIITLGIDIGSTACKCVIMADAQHILAKTLVPLGTGTAGAAQVYERALAAAGLREEDISCRVATGYGRLNFTRVDLQRSELSCHAMGIHYLIPDARTVIDIGGQDIKVLRISPSGSLLNFVMNDKCAAGTGRFLNVMAQVLDMSVEDLDRVDAMADHAANISNTCTVFAESEVISKLASGETIANIVAGIHASVARRVAALAFRNGLENPIAMSGGVALNKGVVRALERELNQKIACDENCQFAGAVGAAVIAFHQCEKLKYIDR